MREIPLIVGIIASVMVKHRVTGLCIEPIGTMADPEDAVPGDYTVRCCAPIPTPEGTDPTKRYMTMFESTIVMDEWVHMTEERFAHNLRGLDQAVTRFMESINDENREGKLVTQSGIIDLRELRKKAHRGSLQ